MVCVIRASCLISSLAIDLLQFHANDSLMCCTRLALNAQFLQVAIKVIQKNRLDEKTLKMVSREISIMKLLNHPNVIRLYEVIDSEIFLFLVMEYAAGGEVRLASIDSILLISLFVCLIITRRPSSELVRPWKSHFFNRHDPRIPPTKTLTTHLP